MSDSRRVETSKIITFFDMAAAVFGERCVHLGNFIELSRLSSNLRSSFLPWRHLASQKISRTKQSTKGSFDVKDFLSF